MWEVVSWEILRAGKWELNMRQLQMPSEWERRSRTEVRDMGEEREVRDMGEDGGCVQTEDQCCYLRDGALCDSRWSNEEWEYHLPVGNGDMYNKLADQQKDIIQYLSCMCEIGDAVQRWRQSTRDREDNTRQEWYLTQRGGEGMLRHWGGTEMVWVGQVRGELHTQSTGVADIEGKQTNNK